jgi:hypothetical protein
MPKRTFYIGTGGVLAAVLFLVLGPGQADLRAKGKSGGQGKGPQVVLHLSWGTGPMEAGRRTAQESAPEGPMSFTVADGGEIYLLDQANLRILRFDGSGALLSTIPVSSGTFQDIEVAGDGRILLLDRLVLGSVVVLNPDGLQTASHPVAGPGIPEGGGITAMFLEEDGLWLEVNHERIVRLLDGSLKACARSVLDGRKAGTGGKTVAAALAGQGRVKLGILGGAKTAVLTEKEIDFGPDLYRIAWVQGDASGNIHAMFHMAAGGGGAGQAPPTEKVAAFRFDGKLEQTGSFESPFTIRAWEQFREFKVTPGGQVYQMAFRDDGVEILKWRYEP